MKTITIDDNSSVLALMRFILNKIDPTGAHFFAENAKEGISLIEKHDIRVVFLDIEMSGLSGDDTARYLIDKYKKIDIIFITGHAEYALIGHKLHCSGFITKPFDEFDIIEALEWLRLPIESQKRIKVSCEGVFTVTADGNPLYFDKSLTIELFAYLVYKKCTAVTNGELISVFWGGDVKKQDLLRKYVKDLRDTLERVGAGNILIKRRGQIGIDLNEIEIEGDTNELAKIYNWY